MQLSQLREDIKRCYENTFLHLATDVLKISEVSLYRKLNGGQKFTAAELVKINRTIFWSMPLDVFLQAYGFTPDTYTPLEMDLDTFHELTQINQYIKGPNTPLPLTMRLGVLQHAIEKGNGLV